MIQRRGRKKENENGVGGGTSVRPLLYVSERQTLAKIGSLIVPIYRFIETVASGRPITSSHFSNPSNNQPKKYFDPLETVSSFPQSVRASRCTLSNSYLHDTFPQNMFNTNLSSSRRASFLGVKGSQREASHSPPSIEC